ncbi:glycosyltransferase involved in cell wall biosynthesis [Bradyrhizobium sp. CIR18]|uniref:glycosyltransferase family 4 protein n=1 Tax=Bradyrhizobium sp. CIR18 TaxID=2663839 RepID=UPI001605AF2E|nr:glycosyltransferase family 4 protein [Bradyrhizobium sp. CIR18]MBB4366821.1 glycosyltransferase involved in cell wall biosynthesis [Bradyrhizobium sp. CIR18]
MKILIVHNNFPAQYRNIAAALAKEPGFEVVAVGASNARSMPSVRLIKYALPDADVSGTHPFARRFDVECRRAEQVLYSLSSLATSGFTPDLILAHPGWGETLPLRTMFPKARLLVYCEFFYGAEGRDIGFDPEFPMPGLDGHIGLQLKNATTLLALEDCEVGISPTKWQQSTFPAHYQGKIDVIHEGVDTARMRPNPQARLMLPNGQHVRPSDEVVTFVARNLEPLRGYHIFMRALPEILRRRPSAQIVIIGRDGVSYGLPPPAGETWKSIFLTEVRDCLDVSRVHFLGGVSYQTFLAALQVSSAHVYFTYPFVLSWSMLEAMSAGCLVIGSDTAPVREVIDSGENGLLVPFFAADELAEQVVEALEQPARFSALRENARRHVVDHYDAEQVCVPRMRRLLDLRGNVASSPRVFWPARPASDWRTKGAKRTLRNMPADRQV